MFPQVIVVWAFGLAGSLHCSSMCGLFAASVCGRGYKNHIKFYGARLLSYTALGFAGGLLGSILLRPLILSKKIGLVISLLMVLSGIWQLVKGKNIIDIQFFKTSLFRFFPFQDSFSKGFMTAFLPCGFLFSALTQAVLISHPLFSALAMAGFSLVTIPALVASSGLFHFFATRFRVNPNAVAGVFLILTGSYFFITALQKNQGCHHQKSVYSFQGKH